MDIVQRFASVSRDSAITMTAEPRMTEDPFDPERVAQLSRRVAIAPGRHLGIAEFGPTDVPPILYFHGFPSSRLEPAILDIAGVRVIGVDRPGYGLSDAVPWKGTPLADFARDAVTLADALGLGRFALLGMSGGAPYAAALAAAFPDRVSALALVSGLGPPEAPGMAEGRVGFLRLLGKSGLPGHFVFSALRHMVLSQNATDFFVQFRSVVAGFECPRDAEAFTEAFAYRLMSCWREGLAPSTEGALADARAYSMPWPFALEDIRVPTFVFHGLKDRVVPASIGQFAAAHIPGAEGHFIPEEGHASLIVNHWRAIMTALSLND
jgi:pimeloyl-ACP methyl ester carboxylesterase